MDSLVPARENPLYARFFDMLSAGTPRAEVVSAMETEGVDAAVLDAPDALFPLPSPQMEREREPEPDSATSYAAEGAEAAAAQAAKASSSGCCGCFVPLLFFVFCFGVGSRQGQVRHGRAPAGWWWVGGRYIYLIYPQRRFVAKYIG